jgi:hypothetical protein
VGAQVVRVHEADKDAEGLFVGHLGVSRKLPNITYIEEERRNDERQALVYPTSRS